MRCVCVCVFIAPLYGEATCGDIDVLIFPSFEYMRSSPSARRQTGPSAVSSIDDILPAVLAALHARGVVTADLTKAKGFRPGERSYMGVARLPPGVTLPGEMGAADEAAAAADDDNDAGDAANAGGGEREAGARAGLEGRGGGTSSGGDGVRRRSQPRLDLAPRAVDRLHRRLDIKVYRPEELPFALLYFTGSDHFNRSMRWWAKKEKNLVLNDKGFFREQGNPNSQVRGDFREEADVFRWLKLAYVAPTDRNV